MTEHGAGTNTASSDPDDISQIGSSPTRISDASLRYEAKRALVWASVIGLIILTVYISQSLLVIFGAMVLASMIDGGARLLGRAIKIPRVWRVVIVLLVTLAFFVWLAAYAGTQISREAAQLPQIVESQISVAIQWLDAQGFGIRQDDIKGFAGNLMGGVGTVTRAIGGILGGLTTLFLITIIGIYVAMEPQLYERGVAWMLPREKRGDFYQTASIMGTTMRKLMAGRLVGMVFEGAVTWIMLSIYGVPMAALLGILTGLLAFIPNIGALMAGVLMVMVGFSGGTDMGLYTVFVYFVVQTFDGYVVIPLIAKKTVDLAPALVLAAQLIMGILFGILGLFLADPMLAMIKVMLERRAEKNGADGEDASLENRSPENDRPENDRPENNRPENNRRGEGAIADGA
ncbi:AI-2E family transporter [Altererythrobacter confluentis]|uniref:AI-2E family transporter n=1 Tax=Allopontixanthobacter confluentis TaxID=1849021 RepID=A0A6L7GCK9_9SPHN|nr:AI-2E family transporter [Allopontixanthobacter confluentis]MXP13703.1 AI-2E family transporter [Allopontixanthobacter confluentis]